MPGVIVLPNGAWYTPVDPHEPFALDLAGNPNMLTADAAHRNYLKVQRRTAA